MKEQYNITQNGDMMRFEYQENGLIAYLEYKYYKKDIAFTHTIVPEALEGKGIASALAQRAFEFASAERKKVMVYCPFISHYVQKHELKSMLDEQYLKSN